MRQALFQRRDPDSSDDQDDDKSGGRGGGVGRTQHSGGCDVTSGGDVTSQQVNEDQENASAAATCNGGDGGESPPDGDGKQPSSVEDAFCGAATETQPAVLNNAVELPQMPRKKRHLAALDSNTPKINNVFSTRSRSAESHISSAYASQQASVRVTARSSSGSLSNTYRAVRSGSKRNRSMKNSSSTRSDTGLVLRYHRGRCTQAQGGGVHPCKRPTRHQSPSCNLRVCNSMDCVDLNHNSNALYNLHKAQSDTFQRAGSYRINKRSTSFR